LVVLLVLLVFLGDDVKIAPVGLPVAYMRMRPQVDGSVGAWTYILSCLYPLHDQPELTLSSVYTLLPVVHKYNFPKLLTRLVAFVKRQTQHPSRFSGPNFVQWLALAERLQLDELREWCLTSIRAGSRQDLVKDTTVAQGTKRVVREEVKQLDRTLLEELYGILAAKYSPREIFT
jgi:hypothetical protein